MLKWLYFALLTVACWGVYGVFLHKGAMGMADPVNGRIKAFLVVGVAYYLVAIVGSLAILLAKSGGFAMPEKGFWWSLVAGCVGAFGALFVLLAFGAKGSPAVVMSIVFAGAPVVNAVIAITLEKEWGAVRFPFILGIILAATGGALVMKFRPTAGPPKGKPAAGAAVVEPAIQNPAAGPSDGGDQGGASRPSPSPPGASS